MKKTLLLTIALGGLFLASCTSVNKTMREPMTRVELYADDFNLSAQMSASAKTTKIFGIDFERLFKKEMGSVSRDGSAMGAASLTSSIPIIGSMMGDATASYALFNLMEANAGYDVVFYPSYTTKVQAPILGLPIFTITTVDVTARLAKFK